MSLAQTLSVAVPRIQHLLTVDDSGVYQQLMTMALQDSGISLDQRFLPYKRALHEFELGEVDCIYSFTRVLETRLGPDNLVYTYPLGMFRFHLFTRPGEATLTSVADTAGKSIGGISGHDVYLAPFMEQGMAPDWVRTESQAVEMLRLGRLDAIIAALPDMHPFTDQLVYAADQPLMEDFDRLNCHNSEDNRAAIRTISEKLRQLHEQGRYEAIAGDYYLPFSAP
ncbi:substrate-binding periplasmic protein [Marinobacter sp.]|uniref:substrate-binding periplasmic protein n=1 Tax=Marinobacter sp. TaxID=50741 RepID=UPI00356A94CC